VDQSKDDDMTVKPIPFTEPMVKALLDGRKSQTRRVLKADVPPQPEPDCSPRNERKHAAPYLDSYCSQPKTAANPRGMSHKWCWWQVDDRCCLPQFAVPYAPGDLLWVREAWRADGQLNAVRPAAMSWDEPIFYEADGVVRTTGRAMIEPGRLRPPMFMHRWASRLTLRVTDVRVERVQSISEADAVAEGIYKQEPTAEDHEWHKGWAEEHGYDLADQPMEGVWIAPGVRQGWGMTREERNRDQWGPTAAFAYRLLWDSLNAKRPGCAWSDNPWVCAVHFETIKANVDQVASA
jgi:hypothetical protein